MKLTELELYDLIDSLLEFFDDSNSDNGEEFSESMNFGKYLFSVSYKENKYKLSIDVNDETFEYEFEDIAEELEPDFIFDEFQELLVD